MAGTWCVTSWNICVGVIQRELGRQHSVSSGLAKALALPAHASTPARHPNIVKCYQHGEWLLYSSREEQNQAAPPPLPRFRFPGTGLQLPTGLTTYKTARPASCQIGRGGSPRNMGTRGAETSSPELLVAWRGAHNSEAHGPKKPRGTLSGGGKVHRRG
jgi:hypothetical protein